MGQDAIDLAQGLISGREGDEDITRAVVGDRAGAGEAERRPPRNPLHLVGQERRVGCHHDDDRAATLAVSSRIALDTILRNVAADRNSDDGELAPIPVIRLHQGPNRVGRAEHLDHPRGGADATLEVVAPGAGAGADIAFCHGSGRRALECCRDVLGLDVKTVDIVKRTVPGLGDDWNRPEVAGGVRPPLANAPLDRRLMDRADAVGVGQHDRAFQLSAFLEPGRAGHLTAAIEGEPGAEDRAHEGLPPPRQDRGHAGPGCAAIVEVLDHGRVADSDAGNVGDRVERPRIAIEGDAEVTGSRRLASRRNAGDQKGCDEQVMPTHGSTSIREKD